MGRKRTFAQGEPGGTLRTRRGVATAGEFELLERVGEGSAQPQDPADRRPPTADRRPPTADPRPAAHSPTRGPDTRIRRGQRRAVRAELSPPGPCRGQHTGQWCAVRAELSPPGPCRGQHTGQWCAVRAELSPPGPCRGQHTGTTPRSPSRTLATLPLSWATHRDNGVQSEPYSRRRAPSRTTPGRPSRGLEVRLCCGATRRGPMPRSSSRASEARLRCGTTRRGAMSHGPSRVLNTWPSCGAKPRGVAG